MRNSHTVLPPRQVNTPSIQHSPTLITLKRGKMRAKQTGRTHRENRNVGHRCIDEEQWGLKGGAPQFVEAALNQPITVKEKRQLVRIFPRQEEGRMRRRGGQVHMKAAEINTVLHQCVGTS